MYRSKIKIVEFDDGAPSARSTASSDVASARDRPTSSSLVDGGIKIREFALGEDAPAARVARPEDVRNIKIVEFENDPLPPREPRDGRASTVRVPSPKQINVYEYDDAGQLVERDEKEKNKSGMKIIEF